MPPLFIGLFRSDQTPTAAFHKPHQETQPQHWLNLYSKPKSPYWPGFAQSDLSQRDVASLMLDRGTFDLGGSAFYQGNSLT